MARSQHWIDENAAAGANTGECYWAADGGYAHAQPGSRLLQYGMGWLADGAVNPSVIYSWYDIDTSEPQPQKVRSLHFTTPHQPRLTTRGSPWRTGCLQAASRGWSWGTSRVETPPSSCGATESRYVYVP